MIILGIDPGLATIGYGVIESKGPKFRTLDYGAIITPPHTRVEDRLQMLYEDICSLVKKYQPEEAAVEELFFTNNITTGIAVAEARGVILLALRQCGVKVNEYTPMQVKQAVVGYGKAEKHQVIAMVTRILNLEKPPKPDDTADALAIAICHAHSGASRLRDFFNESNR